MKVIGRHGDTVKIEDGNEIIRLDCPVPILSFLHVESFTRLDWINRPDKQMLHLFNVHIHTRADLPKDRRDQAVTLRINSSGITRLLVDNTGRYLELSPMDLMNIYCRTIANYPDLSLQQIVRWEKRFLNRTGHDAIEALHTAWAAIKGISHGNPELAARVTDQVSNYPADVAGYRKQYLSDHGK